MAHRITLVHAVRVAIQPVEEAFARHWPDAARMNLLDDSLSRDRSRDGKLTPAMFQRFAALTDYALSTGADGILFTCSAFGPAIEAARETRKVPVLKPNEAMFREALGRGRRLGLLATFAPSVPSMEDEFREMARAAGRDVELRSVCVPEAMSALDAGDGAAHDRLVAEAAPQLAGCDVVMLAQFSTARAHAAVAAALDCPVLTSPDSAVLSLRRSVTTTASSG
jgi:Asp/Glu/hydantoin racemase